MYSDLLAPVMEPPRASTRKLTRKSVFCGLSGLDGLMLRPAGADIAPCVCNIVLLVLWLLKIIFMLLLCSFYKKENKFFLWQINENKIVSLKDQPLARYLLKQT